MESSDTLPCNQQACSSQSQGIKDAVTVAWRRFHAFILQYWFILGVGVAIGLAAAVPALGRNGGYIRAEYTVKYGAVIIIFLLSGLSLKSKVLLDASRRAHLHLYIQLLCLGLTPVVGWGISKALKTASWMNKDLVSGLVVCTSMPTTVSTNVVFTRQAGGDEAVALINAVIGNVIGIFVSPGLLILYLGQSSQAPIAKVLKQLALTVIAPLVVGQVIQYVFPKQVAWLQSKIKFGDVSNVMILLLVWNTFCGTFSSKVKADAGSLALIICVCVLLYPTFTLICYGISRVLSKQEWLQPWFPLSKPDIIAIMMCGTTKTIALGMPLIGVLYGGQSNSALLALPLIIYHASQILQGNLLIRPLKMWVEVEQKMPLVEPSCDSIGGTSFPSLSIAVDSSPGSKTNSLDDLPPPSHVYHTGNSIPNSSIDSNSSSSGSIMNTNFVEITQATGGVDAHQRDTEGGAVSDAAVLHMDAMLRWKMNQFPMSRRPYGGYVSHWVNSNPMYELHNILEDDDTNCEDEESTAEKTHNTEGAMASGETPTEFASSSASVPKTGPHSS